jgi:hypothetical protein
MTHILHNCTATLEFLLTEPHLVCPSTYLLRNARLVFLLTHAWLKLDVQSTGKLLHFHRVVYIVNITLQYFRIIFQMYCMHETFASFISCNSYSCLTMHACIHFIRRSSYLPAFLLIGTCLEITVLY